LRFARVSVSASSVVAIGSDCADRRDSDAIGNAHTISGSIGAGAEVTGVDSERVGTSRGNCTRDAECRGTKADAVVGASACMNRRTGGNDRTGVGGVGSGAEVTRVCVKIVGASRGVGMRDAEHFCVGVCFVETMSECVGEMVCEMSENA
jgi:hypothetical protein